VSAECGCELSDTAGWHSSVCAAPSCWGCSWRSENVDDWTQDAARAYQFSSVSRFGLAYIFDFTDQFSDLSVNCVRFKQGVNQACPCLPANFKF
jgi:hypothetical protein